MQLNQVRSVKDTFFQHKVLTRIHHNPSYESLKNCLNELKANSSSVPTTLGGGMHGHLGLLLSDAIYGPLAYNVLFVIAVHPGPFFLPQAACAHKLMPQKTFGRIFVPPSKSAMQLSKL
mmetsp:Transcript_2257/g.3160  ORF Transcript_2257/g.3160 Transcript_2257/m.3160 type:complete len:119 (-) Transcript_2257:1010-1366(-)